MSNVPVYSPELEKLLLEKGYNLGNITELIDRYKELDIRTHYYACLPDHKMQYVANIQKYCIGGCVFQLESYGSPIELINIVYCSLSKEQLVRMLNLSVFT